MTDRVSYLRLGDYVARTRDTAGAIELARSVVDDLFKAGGSIWTALAVSVLVDALLQRGDESDLDEAARTMDQLCQPVPAL